MLVRKTLTPSAPSGSVSLDFDCVAVVVSNPTGSPVYLRIGGNDVPNETNADEIIPSATQRVISVGARWFGWTFGATGLLLAPAVSGLTTRATVTFLGATERVPNLGSVSYQALSLSALTPGFVGFGPTSSPVTSQTFNIAAWGGAHVYVLPSGTSGQGVIAANVSSDGQNWTPLAVYPFWPGVPATLTLPRAAEYLQIILNVTGIVGEPQIAGVYHVRATLAEINDVVYAPISGSISRPYNVPNLSSQEFILCTTNLRAISVGANNNTGNRAELIIWAASSPAGPWRLVAFREQTVSGSFYNSIYRSLGDLDLFTKISILDIGGGGVSGNFVASIRQTADFSGMLQAIYQAIGDVGQPTNANQSLFHLLQSAVALLTTIDADTSLLSSVLSELTSIDGHLFNIDNNTAALPATQGQIAANTANTATNTSNAVTQLASIDGKANNLATIATNTGNTNTNVAAILTGYAFGVSVATAVIAVGAGAWVSSGLALPAGAKVIGMQCTFAPGGAVGGGQIGVAWGTVVAGLLNPFLQGYFPAPVAGAPFQIPYQQYGTPYVGGVPVPAAPGNTICGFSGAVAGNFLINVYYR